MEDRQCEVPVFRPKWKDFKDFAKYVESIEVKCKKYGLCKVIPPKEFIARARGYHFDSLGFVGSKPRCDPQEVKNAQANPGDDPAIIRTPVRQHLNGSRGIYEVISVEEGDFMTVKQYESECSNMLETLSDREKELYRNRKYRDLERAYWSNLAVRKEPLYGADSPGSLFDQNSQSVAWNCNNLGTLLDLVKSDLPGVTVPMLYFGMWRAMFAWHVEDMNLFSINYLHFGKPKQWYCVPASHFEKTDRLLRSLYPHQYRQCPEFLRHKKCVVSPNVLKQHNIPVHRCIHYEGEFMITFPRSFHAGFNYGFNCAESVNFALKSWVAEGVKANFCKCQPDTVRIDMEDFVHRMADAELIEETDPLFDVIKEAAAKKEKSTARWGKVEPWSCPQCTFCNNRARVKCAICEYRPSKKQMKEAIARAKQQREEESVTKEVKENVHEVTGTSENRRKRKRKMQQTPTIAFPDHEITKFFREIGICAHYANRMIKRKLELKQILNMKRDELKRHLPLGPRIKICNHNAAKREASE
uniref:[Histone H3]-trimethyl-L-lysine(9) demethylase n=3 Tax=Lotharella globosa TaxID=91324 RepID=A0A7S3YH57_9EUKA